MTIGTRSSPISPKVWVRPGDIATSTASTSPISDMASATASYSSRRPPVVEMTRSARISWSVIACLSSCLSLECTATRNTVAPAARAAAEIRNELASVASP